MKCKMRKENQKVDTQRKNVFEKWEEIWKEERQVLHIAENEDVFGKLLKESYAYTVEKAKYNRMMNFVSKSVFLGISALGFLGMMVLWNKYIAGERSLSTLLAGGLAILFVICIGSIISKWIDIRRYQETWARYSLHRHKIEREMLKYIEELEPYKKYCLPGSKPRTEVFIENIIKVWDENQNSFVDNMVNKEKELMDMFDRWKVKHEMEG